MNESKTLIDRFSNTKVKPSKKQKISFIKRLKELLQDGSNVEPTPRESILGIRG